MRWGLVPAWWSKPLKELWMATFNARAETVAEKPIFREGFRRTHCLMPVSGYYEWQDTPSGKQPWYFTAREGSPVLTVAGLWDEWRNKETGEKLKSCAMIITDANDFVGEVHDRMPVLLQPLGSPGPPGSNCCSQPPTSCCSAGRCRGASTVHGRRPMIPR
jgi:putative SOS response-associated peptidase YedK